MELGVTEWLGRRKAVVNRIEFFGSLAFGTALFSAVLHPAPASAAQIPGLVTPTSLDPKTLYGGGILFDVFRAGDKVGFHRVAFDAHDASLMVRSTFQVKIEFLFLTAFRYDYQSTAEWRGGVLYRIEARVDDDGAKSRIFATRVEQKMRISNSSGEFETLAPLFPTNHWNAKVLGQRRVLNTLTGRVNEVKIVPRGREEVPTERGLVPATRFSYTGDLDNEVWYDDAGRWVKMRFKGRDGSTIDYVCRRCQGGATGKSAP